MEAAEDTTESKETKEDTPEQSVGSSSPQTTKKKKKKKVADEPKLTEDEYEILREHIRLCKGMKTMTPPKEEIPKESSAYKKPPKYEPKINKAATFRMNYSKRCKTCEKKPMSDVEKLKKLVENVQTQTKTKIKMNFTSKVRWMKIRHQPVFSTYFKNAYYEYGKPPLNIPLRYEPFNILWEADWIKNPYVWTDEQ